MKRNNEINNDGSRGSGSEEAKRHRSLSESTFGDNNNSNININQHHLLHHQDNADNWLLANQQRIQMLTQSEALVAAAAATAGQGHHQHQLHYPQSALNVQQFDDLNPAASRGGGGIGDDASGGGGGGNQFLVGPASQLPTSAHQQLQQGQPPLLQQPSRVLALENAQTQLAAAMIRQRQAEDTLRQCQQQQAVAVAEYLQQQAAANLQQQQQHQQQQQQQSPLHHHHNHFTSDPQGSTSGGTTGTASNKPQVPQAVAFNDPMGGALSGGLFDLVQQQQQQQQMGPSSIMTTNQQAAAMSRISNTNNSIAAAAAAAAGAAAAAAVFNSNLGDTTTNAAAATTTTSTAFNVSNANIAPGGYSSFLLSSAPAPLNSHLAPPLLLPPPVQLASTVAASGGGGDDANDDNTKKGGLHLSSPKPRKSGKSKSNSNTAAGAATLTTTPKISIAGPKRRPVSLQALVNRGDACYDPGPVRELALPSDRGNLSEYQCLLRKQIVLFSVSINDIQCSAQGRNKPIVIGQVGVLCRHCARIPPGMRPCGASYFPGKLSGLYQAAQNMAINHLTKSCRSIADDTKETLIKLKAQKSTVLGGGKNFWANGAKVLGVVEVEEGHLRFHDG